MTSSAGWWSSAPPQAKRALLGGMLGWMLDAFDVMLFALVLPAIISDLALTKAEAGLLGSVTLVAAAVGGVGFGWFADRFGRTRALMTSIALYSVFTFACGFAATLTEFMIFRIFLGLGMGGEWTSGAALVSESWPSEHRGKALGMMQSGWAIGYGLAALVAGIVQPRFGWRAVFFAGIVPAFLTLWIQRRVHEPEIWTRTARSARPSPGFGSVFRSGIGTITVMLTLMNTCTLFAWWGFNLWLPSYLKAAPAQGGIGLTGEMASAFVVVMQIGMWFGYVTFGFVSDTMGRKRTYVVYLLAAAALLTVYVTVRVPVVLFFLGPFVAFAATGYFSGFGAVTAEIYPTSIRATAQGFTYNVGRLASAAAPYLVGSLADTNGFGPALLICAAAFVLAAITWTWIPETKGRALA
ncbi:MAG TPA: MFS transporter [Vicinamibacterales bacterium]|nr:MFS transporter [Vicinamibacterales bacterium]